MLPKSEKSEFDNNTIMLYPNPTNGIIYINSKENIVSIELINMLGNVVLKKEIQNENLLTLDFSNQGCGLFNLLIRTSNNWQIKKVLVTDK